MIEHVTDLLGAYLDGELRGLRLRQVEEHLRRCAACRKELEELRGLSGLLQETGPAEALPPAERFVANVILRLDAQRAGQDLSRRPAAAPAGRFTEIIWWLVPASALCLWVLLQALSTTGTLLSAANFAGLPGSATAWLRTGAPQSLWFSASMDLFGSHLSSTARSALDVLNQVSVFGAGLTTRLVWQAGIGLLVWGWLAGWLAYRRPGRGARLPQANPRS